MTDENTCSRWIERDGTRLHARWLPGEGVPVVVVPGVMADSAAFEPVVRAMERPEPFAILDRRGHAPSDDVGADYSVRTEADDLLAWVAELGECRLVGWSYGASIAIEAAALRRASSAAGRIVEPVVAFDPIVTPFGDHAVEALKGADLDRRVEIVNIDVSQFPPERVEALRGTPTWDLLREYAKPLADELAAANAWRPDPQRWAPVDVEILVAEQTVGTPPYGPPFERAQRLLPRSRTTVLEGHGHLAHAEDPAALGRALATLLEAAPGQL